MAKEPLLNETELEEALRGLTGWSVEEGRLTKKYLFPTYAGAMEFVNKVAGIAERMNHHPFISIDFRRVTLRLTTWHSGGLTGLDIQSAKAYDGE
ncbi:4a-hydroxytetrahydrobiopterin dehydratase [Cohnella sp. CFH 77786]|uniref:4a-hydroxytetrahydrobiopterin dehydratase n=1 Tax=Cohnella sp. CFH 77786 TaxID=2662265 RepID=UPI001C60A712|nr:4a-hydroxytetrahydrobiopterin dehydratase [Cohnella sp. CFH 77786]MBW5448666.1 4a-hydroxytetrahydrobiopterin dehydratase [Cohnella sp. CFH 77786]